MRRLVIAPLLFVVIVVMSGVAAGQAMAAPSISIAPTSGVATIGEDIHYKVTISIPDGDSLVSGATVFDELGSRLQLQGPPTASISAGSLPGDFSTPASANTVAATFPSGYSNGTGSTVKVELAFDARVLDIATGSNANLSGADLPPEDSLVSGDAPLPTSASAHTLIAEPSLTFTKTADKGPDVLAGEQVTYTLSVTNGGSSSAYDAVVEDEPSPAIANVQLASGESTSLNKDAWTSGDPHMRWVIPGPLAPGASKTITYTAAIKSGAELQAGQKITNTALLSEYFGLPKAARDAGGSVYRTYIGPSKSVSLDLQLPKLEVTTEAATVKAGGTSSYAIMVKNTNSKATAHNVVVTSSVPSGFTADPISSIPPGESRTVSVPVSVPADAIDKSVLSYTAAARSDEVTSALADGRLDVRAVAGLSVTQVSKRVTGTTPTNGNGGKLTTRISVLVANQAGSSTAKSVVLKVTPSFGGKLTKVPASCKKVGADVECSWASVEPGVSIEKALTFETTVLKASRSTSDASVTSITPLESSLAAHPEPIGVDAPDLDAAKAKMIFPSKKWTRKSPSTKARFVVDISKTSLTVNSCPRSAGKATKTVRTSKAPGTKVWTLKKSLSKHGTCVYTPDPDGQVGRGDLKSGLTVKFSLRVNLLGKILRASAQAKT